MNSMINITKPCGYYSLNENGLIVKANDTWLEWLGYQRNEVVGKMYLTEIIKDDHLDFFKEIFVNSSNQASVVGLELLPPNTVNSSCHSARCYLM